MALNINASQIDWLAILKAVEALIAQFGPQALPIIDAWLAKQGLPQWSIDLINAVANYLLSQLPKA